ncbi:MAG: hypothetical protein ABJO28_11430 [Maribacter dokdonensis]|uniref:hypothetical protein n=1 Tax=Maribacter dokdonensis TaxID=320912 RepID=UPI003263FACA
MEKKLKQSILTSYLIGAPIGIFIVFTTIFVPSYLFGDGLMTIAVLGTYGISTIGLVVAFLIALWIGGELAYRNTKSGKSLILTSFKYSAIVNLIIWTTFCLIVGLTVREERFLMMIPPIIAFGVCTILTTFTNGLLIAYVLKRINNKPTELKNTIANNFKKTFVIILTLIGFVTFGQENKIDRIQYEVNLIESDSTLTESEFDWVELTGIATDGGGILKIWRNKNQICKIVEGIGLSYGRIKTTIYLENDIPIKIIETEENFGQKNGELNYTELKEVFKSTVYIFDWENDESKIERIGKRVLSEGNCSTFDYEPIIKRAIKATSD